MKLPVWLEELTLLLGYLFKGILLASISQFVFQPLARLLMRRARDESNYISRWVVGYVNHHQQQHVIVSYARCCQPKLSQARPEPQP